MTLYDVLAFRNAAALQLVETNDERVPIVEWRETTTTVDAIVTFVATTPATTRKRRVDESRLVTAVRLVRGIVGGSTKAPLHMLASSATWSKDDCTMARRIEARIAKLFIELWTHAELAVQYPRSCYAVPHAIVDASHLPQHVLPADLPLMLTSDTVARWLGAVRAGLIVEATYTDADVGLQKYWRMTTTTTTNNGGGDDEDGDDDDD